MKSFEEWRTCKKCGLYKTRRNVVIGEGAVPCDILFIGEAPGKSENLRGKPFIGIAGKIFRQALKDVEVKLGAPFPSHYITNTVACRPCDEKFGDNRQPTKIEVLACKPRVLEIAVLCMPTVIIFLGKVAETYYKKDFPGAYILAHPSRIARLGGTESPTYRMFVRQLHDALKEQGYTNKRSAKVRKL